jgi:hypothetical protein
MVIDLAEQQLTPIVDQAIALWAGSGLDQETFGGCEGTLWIQVAQPISINSSKPSGSGMAGVRVVGSIGSAALFASQPRNQCDSALKPPLDSQG